MKSITARGFRAGAAADFSCQLPGRFSLLVGANNAGKTTVCEALYLAHPHRFPQQAPRPSASALRPAKTGPRALAVQYAFETDPDDEGLLGRKLLADGSTAPAWERTLSRSLGRIRVEGGVGDAAEGTRLIYLPAQRNPVDELARREADTVVELLRAEQQRRHGNRNLGSLRRQAERLLQGLVTEKGGLIESLEGRVRGIMSQLSGGVVRHFPFIGGQVVDDRFLARVLELLLAPGMDRALGQRLELSGLGYVNMLHIAVTLAAIPDLEHQLPQPGPSDDSQAPDPTPDQGRDEIGEAEDEAAAEEDSFFPGAFHATVIIEEPEAHLHPQLQHGLIRHLRQVVEDRPEIQVLVSSHASDLIAACAPEEIVVLRQTTAGRRSFALAELPDLPGSAVSTAEALRMTELHLDVTRSASLFAERLVLVEGISDALILRQFARHWARDNATKLQFANALTILAIGSKVGEWPVRLLATPNFELVTRLAVLTDTDKRTNEPPPSPKWTTRYSPSTFGYFVNHPTLEPAILTPGTEPLIKATLDDLGLEPPETLTSELIDELFRGPVKTPEGTLPAGPGATRKGEFAYGLAARLRKAEGLDAPRQIAEALDFAYLGLDVGDPPDTPDTTPSPPDSPNEAGSTPLTPPGGDANEAAGTSDTAHPTVGDAPEPF